GDPAGQARPRSSITLADRLAQAQAAKTRGGGARQQDCPHRLEADGDGRELRRRAAAWCTGVRRLRDQPIGKFVLSAEPELQERVDGRIDRSKVRDSPWDPLAEARSCGCLELASRKPSWPAGQIDRINRPDIWMQAIRSDQKKTLVARGPSTYGSRLKAGTTRAI